MNPFRDGLTSPGFLSASTLTQASIILLISLFRTFDAKPTAIPDEPFNKTVGTIGKKNLGSIDSPSSSLYSRSSKSL